MFNECSRQLKPQGTLFILYKVSNWLIFDPSCKYTTTEVYLIVVNVTYIRGTEEYDLCSSIFPATSQTYAYFGWAKTWKSSCLMISIFLKSKSPADLWECDQTLGFHTFIPSISQSTESEFTTFSSGFDQFQAAVCVCLLGP